MWPNPQETVNVFSKCDQIRRKLWIWSHLLENQQWKILGFVQCEKRNFFP